MEKEAKSECFRSRRAHPQPDHLFTDCMGTPLRYSPTHLCLDYADLYFAKSSGEIYQRISSDRILSDKSKAKLYPHLCRHISQLFTILCILWGCHSIVAVISNYPTSTAWTIPPANKYLFNTLPASLPTSSSPHSIPNPKYCNTPNDESAHWAGSYGFEAHLPFLRRCVRWLSVNAHSTNRF